MTHKINFHELAKLTPAQRTKLQQRTETDLSSFEAKVRPIIDAVREDGDEALARFARDFDKASVNANEIAATEADFAAAEKSLDPKVREAMEFSALSIRKFHQDQMPEELWLMKFVLVPLLVIALAPYRLLHVMCRVAKVHSLPLR